MSTVFGFTNPASGDPIIYGGSFSFQPTNPGNPYSHKYNDDQIVVQPTGSCAYYDLLENRFIHDPSGWST